MQLFLFQECRRRLKAWGVKKGKKCSAWRDEEGGRNILDKSLGSEFSAISFPSSLLPLFIFCSFLLPMVLCTSPLSEMKGLLLRLVSQGHIRNHRLDIIIEAMLIKFYLFLFLFFCLLVFFWGGGGRLFGRSKITQKLSFIELQKNCTKCSHHYCCF